MNQSIYIIMKGSLVLSVWSSHELAKSAVLCYKHRDPQYYDELHILVRELNVTESSNVL